MDIAGEVGRVPAQIMKSNATTSILTGFLGISLVFSVIFCLQFIFQSRDLRALSAQVNGINMYRNGMQLLSYDCLEYAKRNSAIIPILETVGLNPAKTNPAAAKPATK